MLGIISWFQRFERTPDSIRGIERLERLEQISSGGIAEPVVTYAVRAGPSATARLRRQEINDRRFMARLTPR